MVRIMEGIWRQARQNDRLIILPEGEEERTIEAATIIAREKLARLILLGSPVRIKNTAFTHNLDLGEITIIDHHNHPRKKEYQEQYFQLRRHKGLSQADANQCLENPLYYGCMMLRNGEAAGLVGGALNTTAETVRAGLHVVGLQEGNSTLSSFFLMIVPDCPYGSNGVFLYADAAVVPDPSPRQLCNITLSTAKNARLLLKTEPLVALLSFSTKGSAAHPEIEKITKALTLIKEKDPTLIVDGELQADAALVPEVGRKKAPESPVAGKANVLIFPDLNAGNIGYKLTQRLAKAEAYGPILQGLAKPVNDLSRGCSAMDIVNVVAITATQ